MPKSLVQNGAIYLTGRVLDDRVLDFMYDDDGGIITPRLVREALDQFEGDVDVWVNSPGGDPIQGEAIRVMLKEHGGKVTVKVAGDASSAASMMIMGADEILVSLGSVVMIHDPSTCAFGNSAELDRVSQTLEKLAGIYADVYAERSGMDVEEVRQKMKDETYMTANEAVEMGFAEGILGTEQSELALSMIAGARQCDASSRFALAVEMTGKTYSKFSNHNQSGANEIALGTVANGDASTAIEAQMEGSAMPGTNITNSGRTAAPANQISAQEAVAMDRERGRKIRELAKPFMTRGEVTNDFVVEMIDGGVSVEDATAKILGALSAGQAEMNGVRHVSATIGRDEVDTRREGLAMAMTAKLGGSIVGDGREQPYMGLSFTEMAAVSMGQDMPRHGTFASRDGILMEAMHTASDFSGILSGAINTVIEQAYDGTERTFTDFSREMTFNDFREHNVVRPDAFPSLQKVKEAGEIKMGTFGDSQEKLALGAYAAGLTISRQALVNDHSGAIMDVISSAASGVPEFEEALFWQTFLVNGKLSDGVAMFHANHGNLAETPSAISIASVGLGRKALRTMKKNPKDDAVVPMNAPTLLIVGPELETVAEQFLAQVNPAKNSDHNPFAGRLKLLVTEGIQDKQWYLSVGAEKKTSVMRHGYLDGSGAPRIRVTEPFGTQGLSVTLEHDFGVGGVNHRGAYKNAG